jgi:hypothetical protein
MVRLLEVSKALRENDYNNITNVEILRTLINKFQQDAIELNGEVREAKQKNIILNKRIKKLKLLYHLRFKEDIDSILKS